MYSAPLQSIVESTKDFQSTVWTKLPPAPYMYSSIAMYGQQLLAIGGSDTTAVHALSLHSQSWLHVADIPDALYSTCSITLPNGKLLTLGGYTCKTKGKYSDRVFIGKLEGMKWDYIRVM